MNVGEAADKLNEAILRAEDEFARRNFNAPAETTLRDGSFFHWGKHHGTWHLFVSFPRTLGETVLLFTTSIATRVECAALIPKLASLAQINSWKMVGEIIDATDVIEKWIEEGPR